VIKREKSRELRIGRKETDLLHVLGISIWFRADGASHRHELKDFRCIYLEIDPLKKGLSYAVLR
jgi:hypothetical protein